MRQTPRSLDENESLQKVSAAIIVRVSEILGDKLENLGERLKMSLDICETIRKYFLRNLFERNSRVCKNLVGPRHPTASARHCLPLRDKYFLREDFFM